MSHLEDNIIVGVEDILTHEEQQKIETIQKATFAPHLQQKEESKPFSIWSIFSFNPADLAAAAGTQINKPFNIKNVLYLDKSVIINNISGKNAYIILTPAPIT